MDVKFADKNVIDSLVQFGVFTFFLFCIYGEPSDHGREVVWEIISRWGGIRKEPWCIIGDFNEILSNGEKSGGPRRAEESFKPSSDMLHCCGVDEFSSKGDRFTWGGWHWKKWIQCCLDRSFGNKD